jgi:hypothetical protein
MSLPEKHICLFFFGNCFSGIHIPITLNIGHLPRVSKGSHVKKNSADRMETGDETLPVLIPSRLINR